MYQLYSRYSNGNGYQHQSYSQQYQAEYPDYVPAPQQAQGPPAPFQQPLNPFMSPLAPATPFVAQPKKGKKKKRTQTSAAVVMTTPPVAAVAPTQTANPESNPPESNLPGHEWVLVAKGTATPATSTSPEVPAVAQEPVKINTGLYQAQADMDKVQSIIESALVCLLEPRREHPLSKFGILDAYVPAHHIEVLAGVTTLASIILSGLRFLQVYGVPNQKEDRLLGKSKFAHWNTDGITAGFSHLSHLSPEVQNCKLEAYNEIKHVVQHFLSHFSGHMTFYLRPEMLIKQGAPSTVLQKHLLSQGHTFLNYCTGYRVNDAMIAMSAQEIHDIAKVALSSFEEVKGPLEIRTAVMKSVGIHPKDLVGAAVYLATASDPIPYPSDQDLEDWIGWNPYVREILKDLKDEVDRARMHNDRMGVAMAALMKMVKGLKDAEALRTKAANLQQESKGTETKDIVDNKE